MVAILPRGDGVATFVFWLLVLQNAGVVLLMRYTRATRGESDYVPQV